MAKNSKTEFCFNLLIWLHSVSALTSQPANAQMRFPKHTVPLVTRSAILQQVLDPPQPERFTSEDFGYGLAIRNGTIVAGAPGRTVKGQLFAGKAYVYVEPAQGWGTQPPVPVAELTSSDSRTQVWPEFGWGVAIDGDTIVVGTIDAGTGTYLHEAYVYVKPAGGWTTMSESARLQSPNAKYQLGGNAAVAIQGDTIIAECYDFEDQNGEGAVAVYIKPPQGWTGDIMPVAVLTDGLPDSLGWQLGISGDTIAAAAPEALVGQGGQGSGAVQIYEKPVGGWMTTGTPTATLTPSDPDGGYLGYSMGISGDTVVAGCPYASVDGQPNGAAYVFARNGEHWKSRTQTAKLSANVGPVVDGSPAIGIGVAINGNAIAVGANGATPPDEAPYGGELFIYKKPSAGWHDTLTYEGIAYDPKAQPLLQLGISAAIEANIFVTGGYNVNANESSVGAVCIFELP